MARRVEGPWYRASKGSWYCTLGGKKVSLGVQGKGNRKAAVGAWHRLMTEGKSRPEAPPEPRPDATVKEVIDGFLADAEGRVTRGCLRNYRIFLLPFADAHGSQPADRLTPAQAETYSRKPAWSATYQAQFLGCLATAYRWAVRQRLLPTNPLETLRKPAKASRGADAVVSEADHERLIAAADPFMRDFLLLLWHTGARPGEIAGLTAEQVQASADGVIPLLIHKTADKGKGRFLILNGEAWETAQGRAKAVGSGLLFKGLNGRLTAQAVGRRLARLCAKAGLKAIAYGYRHAFATEALSVGVPDAHVAALLGHSSTTMLHRHYSHLTSQAKVLRESLNRVR